MSSRNIPLGALRGRGLPSPIFGILVAGCLLISCATTGNKAVDLSVLEVPDHVTDFIIDGNPVETKITEIEVDGLKVAEIGWRYTGNKPTEPSYRFPPGLDTTGRIVGFYEITYKSYLPSPIRLIQGFDNSDHTWIKQQDNSQKEIKSKIIMRHDVISTIFRYDIMPGQARIRSDYDVWGKQDGVPPRIRTTYVYYIEDIGKWFSLTFLKEPPGNQ